MQTDNRPAFAIEIHLAETATGWMAFGREIPARYRRAGDTLWIDADTAEEALEAAYREANIGDAGPWVATYRDRDRARSLSIGDVVVLNGEAGFVVDRVGFRPITLEEREILAASR